MKYHEQQRKNIDFEAKKLERHNMERMMVQSQNMQELLEMEK